MSVAWPIGVQLVFFFCSGDIKLLGAEGSQSSGSLLILCPRFWFIMEFITIYLFVNDDSLTS